MQINKAFALFVFLVTFCGLDAKLVGETNVEDRVDLNVTAKEAIKIIKGHLDRIIKQALPMMLEANDELSISKSCVQSLLTVVAGLKQMKDWAGKMLDASSKIPSGILLGTTTGLGSYDECVDIIVSDRKTSRNSHRPSEKFKGRYCVVNVWPPKSLSQPMDVVANASGLKDFNTTFWKVFPERRGFGERFRIALAVCIPSTCSQQDLKLLAAYAMKPLGFGATINHCAMKTPLTINNTQLTIICIFAPLLFIIMAATLFEAAFSHKKSTKNRLVKTLFAFSLIENTKKFLDVHRSDNSFGALAGIRFFSITWIILGHSYYFPHVLHYARFKDMFTVTETQFDFPFMVIQNTALAVDSFFLVSGFLITHSSLKRMKKTKGSLNAFAFFLKRIIRMLPAQFLMMGVLMLMPLVGSGPLWEKTWQDPVETCETSWWSNLLFIQNFWGMEKMCLFHTWFIAIAMQLHVIVFFILIILYRWPILGITLNLILTIGGAVSVGLITLFYRLPPTFSVETDDLPKFLEFYDYVYIQIYSHVGPYCIGVFLGYYMHKNPDTTLKVVWRLILWILATLLGLATVYGLYAFRGGRWTRQSPAFHVSYAATFRTGWAVAVAWIIYDCVLKNESMVNRILSWRPLAVLDRLTFMAYLLHPLVMYYYQARLREVMNTDYIDMIYYFLATAVVTYMLSFFFHVSVEQPINYLDTIFFGSKRVPESETSPEAHNLGFRERHIPGFNDGQREKHHNLRNTFTVGNIHNHNHFRN